MPGRHHRTRDARPAERRGGIRQGARERRIELEHRGDRVGEGLADAIATVLQVDPSLASTLANAAASFGRLRVPHPAVPAWHCPHSHSVL